MFEDKKYFTSLKVRTYCHKNVLQISTIIQIFPCTVNLIMTSTCHHPVCGHFFQVSWQQAVDTLCSTAKKWEFSQENVKSKRRLMQIVPLLFDWSVTIWQENMFLFTPAIHYFHSRVLDWLMGRLSFSPRARTLPRDFIFCWNNIFACLQLSRAIKLSC